MVRPLKRAARARQVSAMPSTSGEMPQLAASPKQPTASASSETDPSCRPPASSTTSLAMLMIGTAYSTRR